MAIQAGLPYSHYLAYLPFSFSLSLSSLSSFLPFPFWALVIDLDFTLAYFYVICKLLRVDTF